VQKLVTKRGKIMVGWDEVLQPNTPKTSSFSPGAAASPSRRPPSAAIAAILSNGYYIDLNQPASRALRSSTRRNWRDLRLTPEAAKASSAAKPPCGPSSSPGERRQPHLAAHRIAIAERSGQKLNWLGPAVGN
jgi:hypothetical protein